VVVVVGNMKAVLKEQVVQVEVVLVVMQEHQM
jgi:hypothetical protein